MAEADRRADIAAALAEALALLGRAEAVVGEMLRAGREPVLAVGVVPVPELDVRRLGVFVEAGGVGPPGFEAWLPTRLVAELLERHPGLRRGGWDSALGQAWSIAWTEDEGPLVAWTVDGGRLRVDGGVVDVLDAGRWTVVPTTRVARLSLAALPADQALIRLHTTDGRFVGLRAASATAAALVADRVAAVLGVPHDGGRRDR